MSENYALVVSAGSGSRFGQVPPKQFSKVEGKTVLEVCLSYLLESCEFNQIYVAVPSEFLELATELLRNSEMDHHVQLISGGNERSRSILLLLRTLRSRHLLFPEDIATVIDANRPLTSPRVLHDNIAKAREVGMACPVLPLTNGVARFNKRDLICDIPKRSEFKQIVTPESARWQDLDELIPFWERNTDLAGLAELFLACGKEIGTVQGDKYSMKITHPEDWDFFLQLHLDRKHLAQ